MKFSAYTISKLADFVCGGNGWPYRRGTDLVDLFNEFGFRDVYEAGFPSRAAFAKEKLTALAGKPAMYDLLCAIADPRLWFDLNPLVDTPTHDECVAKLNELLAFDKVQLVREGRGYRTQSLDGTLILAESIPEDLPAGSAASIDAQIQKCRAKIEAGDYDGAITNARTLLEHLLLAIEAELSIESPPTFDGDLGRLFNRVRTLLNLDPSRKDISDALRQVISGLASIIQGLGTMRNKMSDSHGTTYKPARHHAKLAVNCAMTLADFLFETKAYQKAKGFIVMSATPTLGTPVAIAHPNAGEDSA
ncbi:MAG: abortive infection family protein [Pigmentiphaga sp.]